MADLPKNGESSTASSTPKEGSIPLYLVNGVATVWDAQVAATLHCIHNISGLRAGTLPGVSQQNGFLGLPLTLMKEETAYLVQQGIAHLIPLPTFPQLPTPEQISEHTERRVERIRRLEEITRKAEEEKKKLGSELFEKGGEKARAKREARARAKAEKEALLRTHLDGGGGDASGEGLFGDSAGAGEISTISALVDDNKEEKDVPSKSIAPSTQSNSSIPKDTPGYFLTIPSHPSIPLPSLSSSESSRITTLPHALFPFPSTPREKALLEVFTDLQLKGYRMGLGPRFGGEYLIYPGDYLRYHAHFTSQIIVRDEPIKPAELVAWGRLGTGTKKAGLICCWDDNLRSSTLVEDGEVGEKTGEVEFYSLEWANFG